MHTGVSVDSPAFLRVVAEMSADAAAGASGHDNVGSGGAANGDIDAGGPSGEGAAGGDGGGGSVATIDDAESFHLKTVRTRV